jgi:hypothetical protein
MNYRNFALLAAALALSACTTMHDAAVSTFRVVDAPHQYIRRQLGMEDEPQTTTTTTTETTYADTGYPPAPPPPSYPVQPQPYRNTPPPPPPPVETEREVARTQPPPPPPKPTPRSAPTATPRVAVKERTSNPSPPPRSTPAQASNSDLPYGKPVPGKPGYVYSPYDPNGGYVDVKGFSPGQKVKDPYSGKIFLVP